MPVLGRSVYVGARFLRWNGDVVTVTDDRVEGLPHLVKVHMRYSNGDERPSYYARRTLALSDRYEAMPDA